jgi:hypothetical protein
MRLIHPLALSLACLIGWTMPVHADKPVSPPSPLRLIPAQANFVVQIPQPARLVESIRTLDLLEKVAALSAIKEQLDSTSARRLGQFVAHFEKSLGMKWPALVARLGAGGAALGVKSVENNAPLVLVIQGDDEKLLEKFLATTIEIVESELARQESKEKIEKGDYHGVPGWKIGSGLWLARAGSALVVSNNKDAIKLSLDLYLGKEKQSLVDHAPLVESAKLLPKAPLVSAWLNMVPVQKTPAGKELYKTPRDNGQLTVLFGGYLDLLGRTPYLAAGLTREKDGFLLTIRAPRGYEGMGPDRELHLPAEGQPGSKALLEPKGVLYSSSFYLDIARIWKDREKLFPKVQADGLTNFDKNSGRVLAGAKLSTLLESVGPYHRLVVVNPSKPPYKREAKVRVPAFAFIPELRQADRFARSMDTLLRTGALFLSETFKMELAEEKYKGHDIVGYRFDEKAEVKEDVNDIRYNFSPCFARVGNHFLFCSTIELGRELIDLLAAEEKSPGKGHPSRAREQFYSAGFADLLRAIDDQLITQTILDQAVPPADAKKQVDELIELVRDLGWLTSEARFDARRFRFDLRVRLKK